MIRLRPGLTRLPAGAEPRRCHHRGRQGDCARVRRFPRPALPSVCASPDAPPLAPKRTRLVPATGAETKEGTDARANRDKRHVERTHYGEPREPQRAATRARELSEPSLSTAASRGRIGRTQSGGLRPAVRASVDSRLPGAVSSRVDRAEVACDARGGRSRREPPGRPPLHRRLVVAMPSRCPGGCARRSE